MAVRPWAAPEDVRGYTASEAVKTRTDEQLSTDIFRAEETVIRRTGNPFSDPAVYAHIPQPVKKAVVLLAEWYAVKAARLAGTGRGAGAAGAVKSETFGDYSYTLQGGGQEDPFRDLGLDALLGEYMAGEARHPVAFRLSRL